MTTRSAAAVALGIAASPLGCSVEPLPPEGQVLLYVDTDAILPDPRETAPDREQWPLFDRLRIEVFEPGAAEPCAGCSREFGLDRPTVFEGRSSVGIVARPGRKGYRARVRLYRTAGADIVDPRPSSTLEAVVLLPGVPEEGVVEAHVVLRTDDLGTPQGTLDAPVEALTGPAEGGLAGTWASSARTGCGDAPGTGEVCVHGGAFWMGDLTIGETYGSVLSERLVVVTPFYLDATEVTVAQFRASGLPSAGNLFPSSPENPRCTYTLAPADREEHPVNCITREAAEEYCAVKGARLPTEAEWELVAGARRSAYTVWGDDPPRCEDAVYARSHTPGSTSASKECLALGAGTSAVGSGARDRLALEGGTVVDLAGGVPEWVAAEWAEAGAPCWSTPLARDPLCLPAAAPAGFVVRGASWQHPGSQLRAALRARVDASGGPLSVVIGFRCARKAQGQD